MKIKPGENVAGTPDTEDFRSEGGPNCNSWRSTCPPSPVPSLAIPSPFLCSRHCHRRYNVGGVRKALAKRFRCLTRT
jgi:hypothetical protein